MDEKGSKDAQIRHNNSRRLLVTQVGSWFLDMLERRGGSQSLIPIFEVCVGLDGALGRFRNNVPFFRIQSQSRKTEVGIIMEHFLLEPSDKLIQAIRSPIDGLFVLFAPLVIRPTSL